jgi:hypothetical protein
MAKFPRKNEMVMITPISIQKEYEGTDNQCPGTERKGCGGGDLPMQGRNVATPVYSVSSAHAIWRLKNQLSQRMTINVVEEFKTPIDR